MWKAAYNTVAPTGFRIGRFRLSPRNSKWLFPHFWLVFWVDEEKIRPRRDLCAEKLRLVRAEYEWDRMRRHDLKLLLYDELLRTAGLDAANGFSLLVAGDI